MNKLGKLFTILLSCCFIVAAMPVVAIAAESSNSESAIAYNVMPRANQNKFIYDNNNKGMEFSLTKNTTYFKYSSGPFADSNPVYITFENKATGGKCTHPIYGSVANSQINCNLSAGNYKVTFSRPSAMGTLNIYFFN